MNNEILVELLEDGQLTISRLLLSNYKNLGLNEEEFMLLLHILSFLQEGVSFPTPKQISQKMTCNEDGSMEIIQGLMQRGFLSIEEKKDEKGILLERYSLKLLWDKLIKYAYRQKQAENVIQKQIDDKNVYILFESEFGRPLSPIECETLTHWLDDDKYDPLIIKAALKEAVISGKLNFKYIDRILFSWKKNGVKSLEQANEYSKNFRKYQGLHRTEKVAKKTEPVPFYNWLES